MPYHDESGVAHNWYNTGSGQHFEGTDGYLINARSRDAVRQKTPGWPNAIRDNAYDRVDQDYWTEPLSVNGRNGPDTFGGNWGYSFSNWNPVSSGSAYEDGSMESRVYDRLIAKLIDKIQSQRVNLGEILHTRAQTARMVASTATRIAQSFLALKRGNFAGAARHLTGSERRSRGLKHAVGGIPEQWLALQYGWLPALSDVYNSCETVRQAWKSDYNVFTVRASASDRASDIVSTARLQAHGPLMESRVTNRRLRGNAIIAYGRDPSDIESNLSQLGITNPFSLAWELLPYSFVVDWFIPIGSFLERLDYSRGLEYKHGCASLKFECDYKQRIKDGHGVSGSIVADWSGGHGDGYRMHFKRLPFGSFPAVPTPRLKDPFSLTHVANALSLLATAFKGR